MVRSVVLFSLLKRKESLFLLVLLFLGQITPTKAQIKKGESSTGYQLLVLGIAQDGGSPQANCQKPCCKPILEGKRSGSYVTSLALINVEENVFYLIDCSPDFKMQLELIRMHFPSGNPELKGIFLTHAHIGHYLGLAQLGREVMGTSNITVFALPRMADFLTNNGPWDQLVKLHQIDIIEIYADSRVSIKGQIDLLPMIVPHRDEYSETAGYRISGSRQEVLFIPDIDKWELWDKSIEDEIAKVDAAFLDGTFFDEEELPGKSMDEIPHPLVKESMERFKLLPENQRNKIHFIHLNHSNPLLWNELHPQNLMDEGFKLAKQGQSIDL